MTFLFTFAGFCDLFGAFALDIQKNLADLNDSIVMNKQQNFTIEHRIQWKRQLLGIIEFHTVGKQLNFHFFTNFFVKLLSFL